MLNWLQKIAKRLLDGSEVSFYPAPTKNRGNGVVYSPRGKQRGTVKIWDAKNKRYVIRVEDKDVIVHPKNIVRP